MIIVTFLNQISILESEVLNDSKHKILLIILQAHSTFSNTSFCEILSQWKNVVRKNIISPNLEA